MPTTCFIDCQFCTPLVQKVIDWVKTTGYAQKTKVTHTPTHQGLLKNNKNAPLVFFFKVFKKRFMNYYWDEFFKLFVPKFNDSWKIGRNIIK